MNTENLSKIVDIQMPLGHILLAWQTLSDKFADLKSNETLSKEEKRAIWGLADLLETSLIENGISNLPREKWEALIKSSKEFIKTVPVDFLN
jgi:hypothetical protein